MAAELSITASADGSRLILEGELDTHTAPRLAESLAEVEDGTALVLDLALTTFISSAGLSAMLNAERRLRAGGGSVSVESPTPAVARLIELSGVAEKLGLG